MAHTRTQRRENELPYIPFGPFQIRLPFIHYKIESVEFIQGSDPGRNSAGRCSVSGAISGASL